MSLDKAIKYGQEWREPYRGSKAFDASCWNHKGCPWCKRQRQHASKRQTERAREDWPATVEEFYEEFGTWAD